MNLITDGRTIYLNKAVSVAPDLTKIQRQNRNEMIDKAKDKTSRSENFLWRVVGPRDFPRLKRFPKDVQTQ